MNGVLKVGLAGFAILVIYNVVRNGKEPDKSGNQARQDSRADDYLRGPLDLQADEVPHCWGHDIRAIAEQLKTCTPQKEEFESSEEHEHRKAACLSKPLANNLHLDSDLLFIPDDTTAPEDSTKLIFSLEYHADKQAFAADVKWGIAGVAVIESGGYGLQLGSKFHPAEYVWVSKFTWEFPLPLDKAKSFKQRARLAVVGTLTDPWYEENFTVSMGRSAASTKPRNCWSSDRNSFGFWTVLQARCCRRSHWPPVGIKNTVLYKQAARAAVRASRCPAHGYQTMT